MPLYNYKCSDEDCAHEQEELMSVEENEKAKNMDLVLCEECGAVCLIIPTAPNIGKPGYQMKAVLGSGEHIPGHFGKAAKKK